MRYLFLEERQILLTRDYYFYEALKAFYIDDHFFFFLLFSDLYFCIFKKFTTFEITTIYYKIVNYRSDVKNFSSFR